MVCGKSAWLDRHALLSYYKSTAEADDAIYGPLIRSCIE